MKNEVKQTNSWVWKKIFGITILGWINLLIFQWIFLRISYHWVYVDIPEDEESRVFFWDEVKQQFIPKTFYFYGIMGCILPLTGWYGRYIFIKPLRFKLRLTKIKEYYE